MSNAKIAVFLVRDDALDIGQKISSKLGATLLCAYEQEDKPKDYFRTQFRNFDKWVLVMSTGIAVRFIDGLPADKHSDPAVVVLDEGCHHAVSLLSGHEGGGNALAFQVANAVGGTPVISTATEAVKPLVVGIGCRKGVSNLQISEAVEAALAGRTIDEIRCVATITAKADETGLKEFCHKHDLPLRVFSHEDVAARAWVTAPSEWVQANLGLDGVCEPVALMATPRGKLIVPKFAKNGVTVAVVEDSARIRG